MEWEEPVIIELSKDSDAEGLCMDGSSVSGKCMDGMGPGGPGPVECTFGPFV